MPLASPSPFFMSPPSSLWRVPPIHFLVNSRSTTDRQSKRLYADLAVGWTGSAIVVGFAYKILMDFWS